MDLNELIEPYDGKGVSIEEFMRKHGIGRE
jgi:hypothetical protein